MAIWQWALLLLGGVWALQTVGVWLQMRHYTDVFKGITTQFNDGFVGAGQVRGWLGKGTIALMVVTPDMIVRRAMTMSGRSVFAKFERHRQYEGMTLAQFKAAQPQEPGGDSLAMAFGKAIEQIERVRSDGKGRGLTGLNLASA